MIYTTAFYFFIILYTIVRILCIRIVNPEGTFYDTMQVPFGAVDMQLI